MNIGVAQLHDDGSDAEALFSYADKALHNGKESARNIDILASMEQSLWKIHFLQWDILQISITLKVREELLQP